MNLTVVIFSNGVINATYDNGFPAKDLSGDLDKLFEIYRLDTCFNKKSLPKEQQLYQVDYYISSDPLCKSLIPVEKRYINSFLNSIKTIKDIVGFVNESDVKQTFDETIKPNVDFNINTDVEPELPYGG